VNIILLASPLSKTLWQIIVQYEEKDNWYELKSLYRDLKVQLSRKYGNPESYEFFSVPFNQGDGNEMVALWADKCTYTSFFHSRFFDETLGTISLSIEKSGTKGRVALHYEDSRNASLTKAELTEIESTNN
ncbi:MAG: hypothetical protein J6N21_11255, partial [Butyrivibrio sp.]|nr:hypothetical protein [Butyrivibrio sp.]